MPNQKANYPIIPGGLSDDDRDRIHELFEEGLGPNRIARKLQKHPSTVSWFMYRQGLVRGEGGPGRAYMRNGRPVRPFTAEEDAKMLALRLEGMGIRQITRALGTNRRPESVSIRLAMLAAREDMAA